MHTITRRMDAVLTELEDEFKASYCIDDFRHKLHELNRADPSEIAFERQELCDMLTDCRINYDKNKKDIEYFENLIDNSDIPETIEDVIESMIYKLYTKYKEFPYPEDFMKRIVDKLCTKSDGWQKDTLRLRILKQFIKYGNYLRDADFGGRGHIRRFVRNKINRRLPNDDVETVLNNLNDEVFNCLKDANDDQRSPDGTYGLLKVADDLATGKFRAEGATKRALYLFAIVFNMTYHCGEDNNNIGSSNLIDYDSDIVKNLFNDYYSNNLMRFLTEDYRGRNGEYEREPSGQGINYKNFAEMIYLYYISKDCTPKEKIKFSSEMIERVKHSPIIKKTLLKHEFDGGGTTAYKHLFSEDILNKDPSDFEKFICEEYNHNTHVGTNPIGILQLETEQQTAFRIFKNICKKIEEENDFEIENEDYSCIGLVDFLDFEDDFFTDIPDRYYDINHDEFEEFKELLKNVRSFLSDSYNGRISARNVSRTSIIAAFCYYYNICQTRDIRTTHLSFKKFFDDFQKKINGYLEESYYQPLNGKNIFDVMIVFISYLYIMSELRRLNHHDYQ